MRHKVVSFLEDDLYAKLLEKAGDIPIARYLRRLIAQDVEGTKPAKENKQ